MKEELITLEKTTSNEEYIKKIGNIPILITAPHSIPISKEDGTIKPQEPFTKAIALYLNKHLNTSYLIKTKDTGDSNELEEDNFKKELINIIDDNNIKLVLDLHGAKKERPFDIELGTLNNLSADYSTIKELEESFIEHNIKNIEINNPFLGGGITQYVYDKTKIDIIQIEINQNYRDLDQIENINKLINALISFINQYVDTINMI